MSLKTLKRDKLLSVTPEDNIVILSISSNSGEFCLAQIGKAINIIHEVIYKQQRSKKQYECKLNVSKKFYYMN